MACDLRNLTRETRCVVDGAKQSRDVMWFSGSDVKSAACAKCYSDILHHVPRSKALRAFCCCSCCCCRRPCWGVRSSST